MIWDAIEYEEVIHTLPRAPLPECNRGSWYCPVATQDDAIALDNILQDTAIDKIYDLGAGDLRFAVAMDKRGYDVVAYETMSDLTDFALSRLPENDVEVRNRDYYSEWGGIGNEKAAFVALGKVNSVPGNPSCGIAVDAMGVEQWQ